MAGGQQKLVNAQFGAHVRKIRRERGWTIYELGGKSGYSASTISRLERGEVAPSLETAKRIAEAFALDSEQFDALTQLADFGDRQEAFRNNFAHIQEVIRRREAQAQKIRAFHWQVLPGLIQTPKYMRALFASTGISESAVEEACLARKKRQEVLDNASVEIILSEYSLRNRVTSPSAHIEQLRFLLELSKAERVELGILPLRRIVAFLLPSSFTIYDDTGVVFETNLFEFAAWESEAVKEMSSLYSQIKAASVFGREMRDLTERTILELT